LGDFNTKASKEDIFKPTVGSLILHEIEIKNRAEAVNFPVPNNPIFKITVLPRPKSHKYPWISPGEIKHEQTRQRCRMNVHFPMVGKAEDMKVRFCEELERVFIQFRKN
jgi:hypothetical protein